MTLKEKWNEKEEKISIYEYYPFRSNIALIFIVLGIFLLISGSYLAENYIEPGSFEGLIFGLGLLFVALPMIIIGPLILLRTVKNRRRCLLVEYQAEQK